jgi:hypothetical protein
MKQIPLTQGRFAIVDDEDFEALSEFKWQFNAGYAVRTARENGRRVRVWMHRFINKTPAGLDTDHINLDRLDNRRGNLRTCTSIQNLANMRRSRANTTGAKGVMCRPNGRYRVRIMVGRKSFSLGSFDTLEAASSAYAAAAVRLHGEFARF